MLKKQESGNYTAQKNKNVPAFNETNKTYMLFNNRTQLEAILNLSDVIFLTLDKDLKVVFLNERGYEALGVKDIIDKNYEDLLRGQIKDTSILSFKKFLDSESSENEKCEIYYTKPSGDDCILSWQKSMLKNKDGQLILIIATGQDITERKKEGNIQKVISQILQAASTERNLEELFKFIHDSVSELMSVENFYIALHDKENNMITFPYFIDRYDTDDSPKSFGKGLTEYVIRKGKAELISRMMDEELASKGETELIGTQSEIWLGVPLKIKGNTIGVLAVQDYENENTYTEKHKDILEAISHPISMAIERKRVELEREKLIDKLSELNESKDKLFSLISHDLRGPFNSLLGFSEILTTEYDSLTDDEIKQYLKVIYEATQNLYGMTNNLLQYSQFQIGRLDFKIERLDIEKIIKNNVKLLKGNIVKKEINFIEQVEHGIKISADEDMLNSIIQNLLSNAIKFTNKGGDVIISAKKIISPKKNTEVELRVKDTGLGISEASMKKIQKGEMFSTLGTEREYGTGLGVVLVKEFIEKNRGKLKIESEEHKGTEFICYFPSE